MIFFFNDTATTEIYTLSLHDALPISESSSDQVGRPVAALVAKKRARTARTAQLHCASSSRSSRSGEHTSELQPQSNIGCRLLLEKKYSPTGCQTRPGPRSSEE